ncbi:hypothetical protein PRZ48_004826 [Zasmidium cellare]|uniref:MOSC domain-containing protein n=1 Tax=Zasmidium cellare TaxID=395010 RepID=A0ABR0EQL6_ZASCE|nr:hypothetical protein PRZ48_004826 [Zasmidium cellare]
MWHPVDFINGLKNIFKNPDIFINDFKRIVSDPRFFNYESVNKSYILFILVLIGIFSIALYANLGNLSDIRDLKQNNALGSGSEARKDPNAPPIPPPTEVTSLRIYPIKSCRGFELTHTRLKKSGLLLDRNWMFIGPDGKFLTIRSDPSMTLIDTKIHDAQEGPNKGETLLEISIHGTDARVTIPAFPTKTWLEQNTTLRTVEIWEAETDGYEYSKEINDIFKSFFNKDVALIYKGPTSRMVAINGRKELYGTDTPHHFADVMSLLVASEASIKDLNKRLGHAPGSKEALTIERFRPNIIIKGRDDHPWEEDTWKRIRISTSLPHEEALYKLDLDIVARCARCQVPNVNPDTAEKHPKQPWDTLMSFRRVDTGGPAKWKPCFGMMAIPRNEGKIHVGAKVECLETTDKHWYNERAFADL